MKYEKLATLQTNVVTAADLGTFAVTFAGQSQPWLDTLSSVMASGNSKKLREVFTRAEELLAPLDDDLIGQLPAGFDPLRLGNLTRYRRAIYRRYNQPCGQRPGHRLGTVGHCRVAGKAGN